MGSAEPRVLMNRILVNGSDMAVLLMEAARVVNTAMVLNTIHVALNLMLDPA